jgi:hypothetical protein
MTGPQRGSYGLLRAGDLFSRMDHKPDEGAAVALVIELFL